jgi:hypothetical protein
MIAQKSQAAFSTGAVIAVASADNVPVEHRLALGQELLVLDLVECDTQSGPGGELLEDVPEAVPVGTMHRLPNVLEGPYQSHPGQQVRRVIAPRQHARLHEQPRSEAGIAALAVGEGLEYGIENGQLLAIIVVATMAVMLRIIVLQLPRSRQAVAGE